MEVEIEENWVNKFVQSHIVMELVAPRKDLQSYPVSQGNW